MRQRIRSSFWVPAFYAVALWALSLLAFCLGCSPIVIESTKNAVIAVAQAEARDPRIPALAYRLKRVVIGESNYFWGMDHGEPVPTVFFGQIHQESTWNPEAQSAYASGLAQFTPATAAWVSRLYPAELGDNNPLDVRWAIRSCIIYNRLLYDGLKDVDADRDRWGMTLSSYNGGSGNLAKDRKLCYEAPCCCDQNRWFDHVENFSNRARWAFKENRGYVVKILDNLVPLYVGAGF